MQTRLNPYISFKDSAREAMEFYKNVFGGTMTMTNYKDGGMNQYPEEGDKIMHAMLETDNGITLMAADTPNDMEYQLGANISMSLSGDNEEELRGYFYQLSADGTIREPLAIAPWGDMFGMFTDKFGINWMVNIAGQKR